MLRVWLPSFIVLVLFGSAATGQVQHPSDTPQRVHDTKIRAVDPSGSSAGGPGNPLPEQSQSEAPTTITVGDYPSDRLWIRIDYLAAWLSGARVPPLATASPPGTPRSAAGVLGAPGTSVLVGNETVNDELRSGVRVRLGGWLDDCRTVGFELNASVLDRQSNHFPTGSADGSQIVSRPFFDATTGRQNAELVAFPGVLAGFLSIDADVHQFWAADVLCRKSVCRDCTGFVDVLVGYRYLQFGDGLRATEQLQPLPPAFPPGSKIELFDEFRTANRFHGGVIGVTAGYGSGAFSVDVNTHIALGETTRTVSVNGLTRVTTPGLQPTSGTGGLLAQSTNIGVFRSSDWTVVPDIDVTLGYSLTAQCRVLVGGSLLYWPGVARAGEQIDFVDNPSQLPPGTLVGPARPALAQSRSDLWVRALSVGLEWRY
jgi:hypothetical protein